MKHDAVSVTAMLLFAAFVVERVASSVVFLLPSSWRPASPDEKASPGAARRAKVIYFILSGLLALLVLLLVPEMRALRALDISAPDVVDFGLTWLLLVAGADRIAELVPDKGGGSDVLGTEARPIKIKGTVAVIDAPGNSKSTGRAAS
jgi:hypothetical protein